MDTQSQLNQVPDYDNSLNTPNTMNKPKKYSQPTLQQLASRKAMEQLLRPDFPSAEFEAMEPRLQRLVFEELRTEINRLRLIEDPWQTMQEECPRTDLSLYQQPFKTIAETSLNKESDQGNNPRARFITPFAAMFERLRATRLQLDFFKNLWQPVSESFNLPLNRACEAYIEWRECNLTIESTEADLQRIQGPQSTLGEMHLLDTRISSQLLWYRLTLVFGPPMLAKCNTTPTQAWSIKLLLNDRNATLYIYDSFGHVSVTYNGMSEASSVKALEFLNYVTGSGFKNPTDHMHTSRCFRRPRRLRQLG